MHNKIALGDYLSHNYYLNKIRGSELYDLPFIDQASEGGAGTTKRIEFPFPAGLQKQLNSISRLNDPNEFLILQTVLVAMLYRYGLNNVAIVAPALNLSDTTQGVAIFVTDVSSESSFNDLFDKIKKQVNEYREFGPCDNPRLLFDKINESNQGNSGSLYQIGFCFDRLGTLEPEMEECFKILFCVTTLDSNYKLQISYKDGLYSSEWLSFVSQYFFGTLQRLVSDIHSSIGAWTSDPLERLLLESFNRTAREIPEGKTVLHLFEEQSKTLPGNVAVIFNEKKVDYSTLNQKVENFASQLVASGVKSSDVVAVMIDRSEKVVISILGILRVGAVYLPIDPSYPQERISHMIENSECHFLVGEKKRNTEYTTLENVNVLDVETLCAPVSGDNYLPLTLPRPENLAYIIYTSGSTGKPKGVKISHANLFNFCIGMSDSFSPNLSEHLLAVTSISFDISLLELIWTVCNGICITINESNLTISDLDRFASSETKRSVDFSLFYFASGENNSPNKYQLLRDTAKFADDNNFTAIWTPERHFHEFGGIYPNPALTSAALAAWTSRIALRSGSVVLPNNDVIKIAEDWSVVDNLSGGRIGLSIASGWHPDDFVFFPDEYNSRNQKMYQQISELKELWDGKSIERKNGLGKNVSVSIFPRPIQREIPLWLTAAGSPQTFESAGKIGAGVLTHLLGQEIEELAIKIKVYKDALEVNGFSAAHARVAVMLHTYVGKDLVEVEETVRPAFKAYLRSSVNLLANLAKGRGMDLSEVDEVVMEDLIDSAFERYWQSAALLGTPETCETLIERLTDIGVTEIACLVDFGIEHDRVMMGLEVLNDFRAKFRFDSLNEKKGEAVSIFQTTPSLLKLIVDDTTSLNFLRNLKTIIIGGERLPGALLETLSKLTSATLYNVYGPTETTIWSTVGRIYPGHRINVGRPIANTAIHILDTRNRPVAIGMFGEVYIGGKGVSSGYINNETLTKERFIDHHGDTLYRTGDIGRWLPDGTIELQGRTDNQIKLNGRRIELGEIEAVLMDHAKVKEAVVILRETAGNQQLAAYIVIRTAVETAELRLHVERKLADYMVPAIFQYLDAIPLTPNGKVDRKQLAGLMPTSLQDVTPFVKPKTAQQRLLASTWQEVLRKESISIRDNFFMLGGDSIKAIQIASKMQRAGYHVKVKYIFQYPTIEELADYVKAVTSLADQGRVSGAAPLTPIQKDFFENQSVDLNHHNQSVILFSKYKLDPAIVTRVFTHLQEHHDMLRATFMKTDNGFEQIIRLNNNISAPSTFDLTKVDDALSSLNASMKQIQESISLEKGPLMKLSIFHMADGDRLLIVVHHLVIDAISWRILLEDVNKLFSQEFAHAKFELPAKTSSFKLWSEKMTDFANAPGFLREKSYWRTIEGLNITGIIKNFETERDNRLKDMSGHIITLDESYTNRLLTQVHRSYNTEINDILIAALAKSLRPFFPSDFFAIALEGHGREELFTDIDTSRTVGWFTTLYPQLISLQYVDDLPAHIRQTKESIRRVPSKGIGYGILKYLTAAENKTDLRMNISPDILFNYLGDFSGNDDHSLLSVAEESPLYEISAERAVPHHLDFSGSLFKGKLTMSVSYSRLHFADKSIFNLMQSFKTALQEIIDHCSTRPSTLPSPADFALKSLTLQEFDTIYNAYQGEIVDIYPLSPLQEGILFHVVYEPSHLYNHSLSYRVHGSLQPLVIEDALNELIRRHDVLRTAFVYEGISRPAQVVLRHRKGKVIVKDVRAFIERTQRENAVNEIKKEIRDQQFDLSHDTLLELTIIRIDDLEYELIQRHHHIIMDGWSANILTREFYSVYYSLLNGKTPPASEVIQYGSFMKWLANYDHTLSREHWKKYLSGVTEKATLPGSSAADSYKSNYSVLQLSEVQTNLLEDLARSHNVTLNTVVLTVWGILLSKYNNCSDVVFGSVVSGRPPEIKHIEGMLGLFINTIPVRVKYSKDTTIEDLLKWIQSCAIENVGFHYGSLAEIQAGTEVKQSLIDHILVFENFPIDHAFESLDSGDVSKAELIDVAGIEEYLQTNYDLNVVIVPGKQLIFKFSFNENRYSIEIIEAIVSHLQNLLHEICAGKKLIDSLRIIDEREEKTILRKFSTGDLNPSLYSQSFSELFDSVVKRHAKAIAVDSSRSTLDYTMLDERSSALASFLVEQKGVRPNDVVAVMFPNSELLLTSVLGIIKAAGTFVPVDPTFQHQRRDAILSDSGCKLLLTNAGVNLEKRGIEVLELDTFDFRTGGKHPNESRACSEIAYILYTSGSTGKPKGVRVPWTAFLNYLRWSNLYYFSDGRGFNFPLFTPITFDLTMTSIFTTLLRGDRIYIPDGSQGLDSVLVDIFSNTTVNTIKLTPSHVDALMMLPLSSTSVQTIILGGEAISQRQVTHLRTLNPTIRIFNEYGPTETTVGCSVEEVKASGNLLSVGRPIANTMIYIVDHAMNIVPCGVIGELCVAGAGVAKGYANDEDITRQKFIKNPFDDGTAPVLYQTGDLARWQPDGKIDYLGRKDEQVKIRGHRVEVNEVQMTLCELSGIKELWVVARQDNRGANYLACYFIGARDEAQNLRALAKENLPSQMVPSFFVTIEQLPISANGKLRKDLLPDPTDVQRIDDQSALATTATEDRLSKIWAELLGLANVGVNESFFDLGGHSINAVRLNSIVHKEFNVRLQLRDVFQNPTVKSLAKHIDSLDVDTYFEIEVQAKAAYYEVSHAQKRLWIEDQFSSKKLSFNVPAAYRLDGDLNVEALQLAFTKLIERHEILRTVFTTVGGTVKQVVLEPEQSPFKFVYLNWKVDHDHEKSVDELLFNEARTIFSLEDGPLIRVTLVELAQRRYVLCVVLHHIISDGWSNSVLVNDVLYLYTMITKNSFADLKPLRIQYKDFSKWHNDQINDRNSTGHKTYWMRKLSGKLPVLNLPLDFPRGQRNVVEAGLVSLELDETTSTLLRQQSSRIGGTLYFTILTAINVLLYRYTGLNDIILGTPVAGRFHRELEDQIGFYINTLPLRNNINGGESFSRFNSRVVNETMEALNHQNYPLDLIVESIDMRRDPLRNGLFDVGFTWNRPISDETPATDFTVTPISISTRAAKSDLWIYGSEYASRVHFGIEYSTALFNESTMRLFGERLLSVLKEVAVYPEIVIDQISLFNESTPKNQLETFEESFNMDLKN